MPKIVSSFLLLFVFVSVPVGLKGQAYAYFLKWGKPQLHTFLVEIRTQGEAGGYTDFKLPVWRPGTYVRQDYAASVSAFEALAEKGSQLKWEKVDSYTWRIYHASQQTLKVRYRYFANKQDAGSSYVGKEEIYFNPINLFMYVSGRLDAPVSLSLAKLPAHWKVASALDKGKIPNQWKAASYHEFVDSPVAISPQLKTLNFSIEGIPFFIHFLGEFRGGKRMEDEARVIVSKICRAAKAVMGEFPFPEYHFIYRLVPYDLFHAVEHARSSFFVLPSDLLYGPESLQEEFAQVTAHEFWHVWNVKAIRPAPLLPYDYGNPPYTGLHWFTEGVTDYYAEYLLLKAGIIDKEEFLARIAHAIAKVENHAAVKFVSPTESSMNSWLVHSRQIPPHLNISYYTVGKKLGVLLDLALRKQSQGKQSLDDLFRYLYENYARKGLGVPEDGIQTAMEAISGVSWEGYFQKYVHGTVRPPYKNIFAAAGVQIDVKQDPQPGASAMGISRMDYVSQGIVVRDLRIGGDAHRDGLGPNDLILEIDGRPAADINLDDHIKSLPKGSALHMKVYRDRKTRDIQVEYQGANAPRRVSLIPLRNASTKQLDIRDGWLGVE